MGQQIETDVLEEVEADSILVNKLVVHNDDVNTFDHVIEALIDICSHTFEQAEQCAMIIHLKGKCSVKTGSYKKLVSMKDRILDRGIMATIET
jgi:ATP-dependent Clp protease adaptor protein ClpS